MTTADVLELTCAACGVRYRLLSPALAGTAPSNAPAPILLPCPACGAPGTPVAAPSARESAFVGTRPARKPRWWLWTTMLAAAAAVPVLRPDAAPASAALVVVYLCGYVTGALLIPPDQHQTLGWAIVRTNAGLLLSTLGFLASLVSSVPWFAGPGGLLILTVLRCRSSAFSPPRPPQGLRPDLVAATLLGLVILSPVAVSSWHMAGGAFPPVFFNVDSAYFLEKVHALARAEAYPPGSLSNLGGTRTYHYATHGMAAMLARASGLPPHQALFAYVLPLLALGLLASAAAAARRLAPALPAVVSTPLLLLAVPSFWYSHWDYIAPRLLSAMTAGGPPALQAVAENYELWGVASIVPQNVGAHMLVLAALAAIAGAPAHGWRLPVFLVGSAVMVKASAGIALLGGFALAQACQAMVTNSLRPVGPAAAAATVFLATYTVFWIVPPTPPDFATELFPLFHYAATAARDGLIGLGADVIWLLLPALLAAAAGRGGPVRGTLPLLLFGLAPFAIVNATRSIDMRPGGGGASDDWLQILLPAPFVLHAFVLAFVNHRWRSLPALARGAVVVLLLLTIAPVAWVAARYSNVVIRNPQDGHEFVDNRAIAEALAAIPVTGTLLVTNDLRYPAQRFNRDNRQMQVPALFGHQAFAVNYAYEVYAFSRARRELQALLSAPAWSEEIDRAARAHGWTHLLIRKDFAHPAPVPLLKVFENAEYAVFRFRAGWSEERVLPTTRVDGEPPASTTEQAVVEREVR